MAKTDIAQLAALVGLGLAAAAVIVLAALKPDAAQLVAADEGAAARSGADGSLGWTALLGYYLLWSLADPMFPHFMQRFFAAKSDGALLRSMAAYPFALLLVFLPMSAIGVLGRSLAPGLSATQSDGVFTLLTARLAGPVLGPLFSIAALAALMSTMDSQLLSCASMLSADLLPKRGDGARRTALAGAALAFAAWLVALRPPEAMLSFLNRAAFPGYASLAPVALAAIYAPGVGAAGAASALAAGALLVLAQSSGAFTPPVPAVFFNAAAQSAILASAWLWRRYRRASPRWLPTALATGPGLAFREARIKQSDRPARAARPVPAAAPAAAPGAGVDRAPLRQASPAALRAPFSRAWSFAFLAALVAGVDFWSFSLPAWEKRALLGLPYWLWYQIAAVLALGGVFCLYARRAQSGQGRRLGLWNPSAQ